MKFRTRPAPHRPFRTLERRCRSHDNRDRYDEESGVGAAATSSTGFYLSANTSIGSTDIFIGSSVVGALGSGETATASASLHIAADTPPGSYYVIGRADWNTVVAETVETNNDRESASVKVGGDLVLSAVSAPGAGMANGFVTVTETTKNQGVAPVPESATGFYLSSNTSYDSTDIFLGGRPVDHLHPRKAVRHRHRC